MRRRYVITTLVVGSTITTVVVGSSIRYYKIPQVVSQVVFDVKRAVLLYALII